MTNHAAHRTDLDAGTVHPNAPHAPKREESANKGLKLLIAGVALAGAAAVFYFRFLPMLGLDRTPEHTTVSQVAEPPPPEAAATSSVDQTPIKNRSKNLSGTHSAE